jgi:ASC-1-like (ASCH) protein
MTADSREDSSSFSSSSSSLRYCVTLVSPWFELSASGTKTFEGRVNYKQTRRYKRGDVLQVAKAGDEHATEKKHVFFMRIKERLEFPPFEAGLTSPSVPLSAALPGVDSVPAGVAIYNNFYSSGLQRQHGIVFLKVERISPAEAVRVEPATGRISLWLMPAKNSPSEAKLKGLITDLSTKYKQAEFEPHITLASMPYTGVPQTRKIEEGIRQAVAETQAASGETDLSISCEQLAFHPVSAFMVVFFLVSRSSAMLHLRSTIHKHVVRPMQRWDAESEAQAADTVDPGELPPDAVRSIKERTSAMTVWPNAFPFTPHASILYDKRQGISALRRAAIFSELLISHPQRSFSFAAATITIVNTTGEEYEKWSTLATVEITAPRTWSGKTDSDSEIFEAARLTRALLPSLPPRELQRLLADLSTASLLPPASQGNTVCASCCILIFDGQIVSVGTATHAAQQCLPHAFVVSPSDGVSAVAIAMDPATPASAPASFLQPSEWIIAQLPLCILYTLGQLCQQCSVKLQQQQIDQIISCEREKA